MAEPGAFVRIGEKSSDCVRQRGGIAVWKRHATRPDSLRKSTASRPDDDATARDSLQRDDAERLLPERRDDEDLVLPQQRGQLLSLLLPDEMHVRLQLQIRRLFFQGRAFRPVAGDRQARLRFQ